MSLFFPQKAGLKKVRVAAGMALLWFAMGVVPTDAVAEPVAHASRDQEVTENSPVRGYLGLGLARQTGGPWRWVKWGPEGNFVLDHRAGWGAVYGDIHFVHNRAYHLEGDPNRVRNRYESEGIVRQLYYRKAWSDWSIQLGRQIVVWGVGDYLSLVNLLTPSDQGELFFAAPADARLGQDSLHLSYSGLIDGALVVTPKPLPNRIPQEGHPYGFKPDLPEVAPESPEAALRLAIKGRESTLALVGGQVTARDPLVESNGLFFADLTYPAYRFVGLTYTRQMFGSRWKGELVHYHDEPLQNVNPDTGFSADQVPTYGAMLGWDVHHDRFGSLTVEGSLRVPIDDHHKEERTTLGAVAWHRDFFEKDARLQVTWLGFDGSRNQLWRGGWRHRLSGGYEWLGQYTWIHAADQNYKLFSKLDRFDFGLRVYFSGG